MRVGQGILTLSYTEREREREGQDEGILELSPTPCHTVDWTLLFKTAY